MMQDEVFRRELKAAADECLSGVERMPSRRGAVLSELRAQGARGGVRRKASFAAVMAIVLAALAVTGAAVGLGLFGRLREGNTGEMNGERLALLEEAVQDAQGGPVARLVQDGLDLTVDQAYCDGRKLYYAYTLRTDGARLQKMEGEADGFGEWDVAYPGERFEDMFSTGLGEEADRAAANWLNSHARAYVIVQRSFVGDGAELADGTYLTPLDSGDMRLDETTTAAFYEVELPQGAVSGERLEFVLNVMTSTSVYYQDETGVYALNRYQPDALVRVPVTIPVTGSLTRMRGEGTADGYPAVAELYVSDVDVSGVVRIDAPEDYHPEGYVLVCGGVEYPNLEGYATAEGEVHEVHLRFDLPEHPGDMKLVPEDRTYMHETIELKGE
ncbi:MAG: DUF4179 domain-containing protein [Candidatus Ventricola sp.]